MEECKRTKIEWTEIEIESKKVRKVNPILSLLLGTLNKRNAKLAVKAHLYPILMVKTDTQGKTVQTKQLIVDKCPLCGETKRIYFASLAGTVKVSKCVCGAKWEAKGRKKFYTHKTKGGI